ncbi:LPXTG cell wall anchor domain-containing protein [Glycomyces tenuis]|uniref:LPXTG cell wall anchor domain-containing protein n=1 Tax=Glycomyces tenuis TaxID=58116 RepID=UPI0004149FF4|nr:LPXTG cell wall anchor domain-containing protein [Glycomyces tenuis]
MNRTLKRVLGLAGSVALGVAGAVTFASAAQAHHPEITGTAECVDGGWEVTWNVELVGPVDGKITEINPTDPAIDGNLQVDAVGKSFTGTQLYPASATEAHLEVSSVWYEGQDNQIDGEAAGHVVFDGTCSEEPPGDEPEVSASAVSDCLGLTVIVGNNNDTLAEITMTPSTGEPVTVTPAVGEPVTEFFAVEDPAAGLTVTVTTGETEVGVFTWNAESLTCEWGVVYDTCDGLEFELSVPETAAETTVTLTPSEGDEVVVVLEPGAEPEIVEFPATGDELTVSYVINDGKSEYTGEVPWTKPEGCEEAPAGESPTPAAQLPETGSSMTIMISAAAALVVAAAVLFFIARRRRAAADW